MRKEKRKIYGTEKNQNKKQPGLLFKLEWVIAAIAKKAKKKGVSPYTNEQSYEVTVVLKSKP